MKWCACICATVLQIEMHVQQGGFMHNNFLNVSYQVNMRGTVMSRYPLDKTLLYCIAEDPGASICVITGQLRISRTAV
ncbi:hypothetical protein PR048_014683 [Dryococelus australis]|uniref:Secreted protein n=1 Tax=Dryococelus australis TaxID=614101 RepID=A0ABQ9HEW6_9NEOP|nr:hypothetical protein PR048_014683 [Dryococelus australis]